MLIQTHKKFFDSGYQAATESNAFAPAFGGANVAIRREVFDQIGAYDERCLTGEDIDLSIRTSKAKWRLYFEPRALVVHKNHQQLIPAMRQWFRYGYYQARVFKKHNQKCLEVFYPNGERGVKCLFATKKVLFPVLLFLNTRLLLKLLFAIAAVFLFSGQVVAFLICVAGVVLLSFQTLRQDFDKPSLVMIVASAFVRSVLRESYFFGGLLGGIRVGLLYLNHGLDKS